ncbi:IQ domain-containing protein C isoform X2 [Macrotis lagotis]|uniref:IQ domain-containing protein C isoform X2 n=1 Tax=Macrotis lagotis TaxID=92651 RepID=UPI003D696CCC
METRAPMTRSVRAGKAMELPELVRRVTRLQACVRGRQTRRRLRDLRAEYEEVVRQLEGAAAARPRWEGRWLPRPVFSPDARTRARGDGGDARSGGGRKGPGAGAGAEAEAEAGPAPGGGGRPRDAASAVPACTGAAARLQRLRRHLAMEMLWLQQAIVSRKKYLLFRQALDLPED